ncbi:proton pump-interactor 1-like [Gossypium raimondii]|uniref:proton pump-interactor 1-like n=1 Tax=Gossypium raimondii TaxID=29730 RepID=UPI00227B4DA8|nr:proton pump-interactor 1-like [Gossypium raimondii]
MCYSFKTSISCKASCSLKKEANLKNAEAITKAAKRKYYEETEKLSELQYQFKAANDIQQEAYAQLQRLKKQSYEKNKHFWQYKDDLNKANELASKGYKVALQNFCINQIEHKRKWRWQKAEKVLAAKVVEKKKLMQSAPTESVSATASNRGKIKEAEEEKPKRTEEEESDRKAEELSKEDEAAKSKDQRRSEEVAKAKEALERKRGKAEKAKAREAKRAANEAVAKPPQNFRHSQHREKTSTEEAKARNCRRRLHQHQHPPLTSPVAGISSGVDKNINVG